MKKIPYLNILLFALTFLSTLVVGAYHEGVIEIMDPFEIIIKAPLDIYKGLPFSITLLFILLTHEFAHYLASKKHHVEATLPYFIPAPTIFGTLGAFIKMKSPIPTRNALMDIGASGPIYGFIVSVAAVIIGLFLSNIVPADNIQDSYIFGSSLLFSWLAQIILGVIPDNHGVSMHSIAFAGWIGFFVTSLNLIPVGQLDGGHIAYALFGGKQKILSKVLIGVLLFLGILWPGWIMWAVLLVVIGFRHPPIIYSEIPLDPKRKKIGWAAIVIFILTFTPIPIIIV